MIKLNNYIGYLKLAATIDVADGNPIEKMSPVLEKSDIDGLFRYFKSSLNNFLKENFDNDIDVSYHIIKIGDKAVMGLCIKNLDVFGMEEYYIVRRIDDTTVHLLGCPTNVTIESLHAPTLETLKNSNFYIDMSKEDEIPEEHKAFRTLVLTSSLKEREYKLGLQPLIKFNCLIDGDVYCSANITIAAQSIWGVYKAIQTLPSDTMAEYINRISAKYVRFAMFDEVDSFYPITREDYLTLFYMFTEKLSKAEAHDMALKNEDGDADSVICLKVNTEEGVTMTLYYDIDKDLFYMDKLEAMRNGSTLAVMIPRIFENKDYYAITADISDSETLLAAEGKIIQVSDLRKYFMAANISALQDTSAVKPVIGNVDKGNPADIAKISQVKTQIASAVNAMDGIADPDAKTQHFKTKVIPLIKTSLGIAYAVGYVLQPMAFGLITFATAAAIGKDGLSRAGDRLKAIDAALDEYLIKAKGKTDSKSVAYVANINSLKKNIAGKLKGRKEEEDVEEVSGALAKEAREIMYSFLIKDNTLYYKNEHLHGESVQAVMRTTSLGLLGGLLAFDIWNAKATKETVENSETYFKRKASEYMQELDRLRVNPFDKPNEKQASEIVVFNSIASMLIWVFGILMLPTSTVAGSIALTAIIGSMLIIRLNGRTTKDLMMDILTNIEIYLLEPADNSSGDKLKSKLKGLTAEEIALLDSMKKKVNDDLQFKNKVKDKITSVKKKVKTMGDDISKLEKECFDSSKYQLVVTSTDNVIATQARSFNSIDKLYMYDSRNILVSEASVQELSNQVFDAIKGLPRAIYTKYREIVSRMKSEISKFEQARDDEEREEILNKEFSPTFARFISFIMSVGVATIVVKLGLLNPIIAVIGVLINRVFARWQIKEKKKRALNILRSELNVAEEMIEDAKNDNNREAKVALIRTRDKIKDMLDSLELKY